MRRRLILAVAAIGFLAMASHGLCHQRVARPVVRFIDFYVAAEHAEQPMSLFERITVGLLVAAHGDLGPRSAPDPSPGA